MKKALLGIVILLLFKAAVGLAQPEQTKVSLPDTLHGFARENFTFFEALAG
jgi:hypothetical protein